MHTSTPGLSSYLVCPTLSCESPLLIYLRILSYTDFSESLIRLATVVKPHHQFTDVLSTMIYPTPGLFSTWFIQHLVYPTPGLSNTWFIQHLVYPTPGLSSTWFIQHLVYPAPWFIQHLVHPTPGLSNTWFIQHLVYPAPGLFSTF